MSDFTSVFEFGFVHGSSTSAYETEWSNNCRILVFCVCSICFVRSIRKLRKFSNPRHHFEACKVSKTEIHVYADIVCTVEHPRLNLTIRRHTLISKNPRIIYLERNTLHPESYRSILSFLALLRNETRPACPSYLTFPLHRVPNPVHTSGVPNLSDRSQQSWNIRLREKKSVDGPISSTGRRNDPTNERSGLGTRCGKLFSQFYFPLCVSLLDEKFHSAIRSK